MSSCAPIQVICGRADERARASGCRGRLREERALLGVVATRTTVGGAPRGVHCGIGLCFDCLVVVDGAPNTRACMTLVRGGMDVKRQEGWA